MESPDHCQTPGDARASFAERVENENSGNEAVLRFVSAGQFCSSLVRRRIPVTVVIAFASSPRPQSQSKPGAPLSLSPALPLLAT